MTQFSKQYPLPSFFNKLFKAPGHINLTSNESSFLISLYSQFLELLISQKRSNNNIAIEPNFQNAALHYLQNTKAKYSLKKLPKLNETNIKPIGEYRIFGVDLNRSSNRYLSDYDMVRKGKNLNFIERVKQQLEQPETQKKSEILGKKLVEDCQKLSEDDGAEKQPNLLISTNKKFSINKNIMKIGLLRKMLPSKKPREVKILKPKELWKNMSSSTYSQLAHTENDYICIEDFLVISHLGLIMTESNSKNFSEENANEEFEGFCHFIRTERKVFGSID